MNALLFSTSQVMRQKHQQTREMHVCVVVNLSAGPAVSGGRENGMRREETIHSGVIRSRSVARRIVQLVL